MSTSTANKTPRTIVASASNSAGSTTRGTLDLRTAVGGFLTMRITNGSTGPTAQCEGRVMIAHDSGTTPTAGAAGATWKTIFVFGGGTAANLDTFQSFPIDPAVMHVQVEFAGNTNQAVTVEAYLSELTSYTTA